MKIIVKTLTLLCLFLMAACQKQEPAYKAKLNVKPEAYDLEFDRYEEVLFNLDTADFQQELKRIQDRYKVFIGGDLNNPQAVQYLKDFATDPFSITLYDKVMTTFPDLKEVEPVVEDVMAHFHYYYPDISLPQKAYTCITGVRPDEPPVQIIADNLVISLDWYLNGDVLYDQIGMPRYMAVRTHKATLAKDVALCLYMYYLYEQRKQGQIISEMVFYGRRNFFVEAMCPTMADSVVLGYSSSQWQWAVENEGAVWADIVGNRRLYEAGLDTYMMFFGDGPFTQAYSNDAPSRLGEFFGLNITRSYFSNNEISLQDLIHRKDLQEIFQNSGYKPKK